MSDKVLAGFDVLGGLRDSSHAVVLDAQEAVEVVVHEDTLVRVE